MQDLVSCKISTNTHAKMFLSVFNGCTNTIQKTIWCSEYEDPKHWARDHGAQLEQEVMICPNKHAFITVILVYGPNDAHYVLFHIDTKW